MRVLFLTCHLPYPPISGGRLRELQLLQRLAAEADIQVCAISKTYEEDRRAAGPLRERGIETSLFPASSGSASLPPQVRQHSSPAASRYVCSLLREGLVDLIHTEGFYLLDHVPDPSPVPVLLVEQNVEYNLWAQRVALAHGQEAERRTFRSFRETRAHELEAWRRADMCAAVTADDRQMMLHAVPDLDVRVIPDGADHLGSRPAKSPLPRPELVFVANFAYQPNADAASWFCSEILPLVRKHVPEARALLVGNAPPAEVQALGSEHVLVTGRVPTVAPYLDRAAVVVSPLRVGGGVKVKVLEALGRGKAIVTTSVGAQGLGPDAHGCIALADEASNFAAACCSLLRDSMARMELEERARNFSVTLPTWDQAASSLLACYHELMLDREALSTAG